MSVKETIEVPLDQLRAHPKNARVHDIDTIKGSLQRHGQFRAVVAQRAKGGQKRHTLLAGHGTYRAAKELGYDTLLVHLLDVDDDTAKRILLVDNRANDLASYDDAGLAELLGDLPDLDGTGFDQKDLDKLVDKLHPPDESGAEHVDTPPEEYEIVVTCDSEQQQLEMLERLAAEGLKCRALVL